MERMFKIEIYAGQLYMTVTDRGSGSFIHVHANTQGPDIHLNRPKKSHHSGRHERGSAFSYLYLLARCPMTEDPNPADMATHVM